MSFLQPWMLAALPLALLPVIIHLINQRRYQNVPWAAMMFLIAANRMSRGFARIRQWLILAVRVAALAALLVAVARPLAGGWLGLAGGGRADTTLLVIDRSASMGSGGAGSGATKLQSGLAQLAGALETTGSGRWVLIESGSGVPRELESPAALRDAQALGPTAASADLPALLESARSYIAENKVGRTEVWILSDLRAADWDADSGRWTALRDAFLAFPQGVRFHLLAYPQSEPGNLGVRAGDVRLRETSEGAELLVSVALTRDGNEQAPRSVPLRFEIDGARSEVAVEITGSRHELKDHRIALGKAATRGWGRVSIPADGNPSDDEFYFVYDVPPTRTALVVADDPQAVEAIGLAAGIAPEAGVTCAVETAAREQLSALDWESIALLVWQGELPSGDAAPLVQAFLDRGGDAIFLPPRGASGIEFAGVKWTGWTEAPQDVAVEGWRGDQDLLAQTRSGAPLPGGTHQVRRHCGLEGELTPLATLKGGAPLLARATTERGAAYFLATTPAAGDSSLAVDGVALYVLVHRAMAAGAASLGQTRQLDAGESKAAGAAWTRVAGAEEALSTEYPIQAGVYTAGERLMAVNRTAAEDAPTTLDDDRVDALFRGLDFARVEATAGQAPSLIEEIWRAFLTAMLILLVGEAVLCLPKPVPRPAAGAFAS
jgi:hypothetical protein